MRWRSVSVNLAMLLIAATGCSNNGMNSSPRGASGSTGGGAAAGTGVGGTGAGAAGTGAAGTGAAAVGGGSGTMAGGGAGTGGGATPAGSGGGLAGSAAGVGASAGVGAGAGTGAGGTGGTGGAAGLQCGGAPCLLPTAAAGFNATACCTADNRCGAMLPASPCIALDQPGRPDPACPGHTFMGPGVPPAPLLGCCRSDNKCGLDVTALGFGCVERTQLPGQNLSAVSCTSGGTP